MINNRQGGRRRGRGGQRPQNLGGRPDGNRQDNRQRGNAAQLLEKYKSMARDAQLGGDRVQAEYYLQFADHYFRVLGESRSRFEDQRRQRGDDGDDEDSDEEMAEAGDELDGRDGDGGDEDQRYERSERPVRQDRGDRPERAERGDRPERSRDRPERSERPRRYARDDRNGEETPPVNGSGGNFAESIALDVLPPAIGRDEPPAVERAEGEEEATRPRRRVRRPRTDGDDIAPAA